MIKLIPIIIEIIWTIVKGIAKQNEEEKAKREKLKVEAKEVWEKSPTRRNIDRLWSGLRK